MKKRSIIGIITIAAIAVIAGIKGIQNEQTASVINMTLSEIESVAACESIGWWDNDGNCVKNDKDEFFCKSDSWHEFTDCLQK